jgi:hypothetical protein
MALCIRAQSAVLSTIQFQNQRGEMWVPSVGTPHGGALAAGSEGAPRKSRQDRRCAARPPTVSPLAGTGQADHYLLIRPGFSLPGQPRGDSAGPPDLETPATVPILRPLSPGLPALGPSSGARPSLR